MNFNLNQLIIIWIIIGIIVFPILLFVKQPYGRHYRKGWGPAIPNKYGWVIMELPSLLLFTFYFITLEKFNFIAVILFLLWFSHYFNRTLVYPFRIKTKGKKMPVLIIVFGIFFNLANASFNGLELNNIDLNQTLSYLFYLRLSAGLILFIAGMAINISSDNILINLRKNSTNGYKIPEEGIFKWVSCPNYLGEIMEWIGFALIAWNLAALSFAVWSFVNLVPRAIDHHKWYHSYFNNYPAKRKAIFPFLL